MTCQWGCDQDCQTYGEHLRNKSIGFNGVFASRTPGKRTGFGDAMKEKDLQKRLSRYEDLRKQGIQPGGHGSKSLDKADRRAQETQTAYDAAQPYKNVDLSKFIKED